MEQFKHSFEEEANVGMTERLVSAGIAAALGAYGITKIAKPFAWFSLAAAVLLAYRGVTGYSMLNEALGRNTYK